MNDILFLIEFFLSFVMQTITGFAGTVMAMPPAMLLLGMDDAKIVLNVLAGLSGLFIAIQNYRHINYKELAKMSCFMLVGMVIGLKLYTILTADILLTVYGIIVVGIGVKNLLYHKKLKLSIVASVLILMIAGVVHGMFVSGGALLVIYAVGAMEDKDEFRATVAPIWVILNGYMAMTHIQNHMFNNGNIKLIMISMIPLALSIVIGNQLQRRIKQEIFLKLTYVLLILSGTMILI